MLNNNLSHHDGFIFSWSESIFVWCWSFYSTCLTTIGIHSTCESIHLILVWSWLVSITCPFTGKLYFTKIILFYLHDQD